MAFVASSAAAAFAGCSRQSEGERCDRKAAGNTDCNEGLVCVQCIELAHGQIDRCCPSSAAESSGQCVRADPQPKLGH